MLVLTLRPLEVKDEMVYNEIGGQTVGLALIEVRGKTIKLGLDAKKEVNIYRGRQDGTKTTRKNS